MKISCKAIALLIAVQAVGLVLSGQAMVYAGHQGPVLAAVNSARRQGVPEKILTRLLAYTLDNQLDADHTVHLLSILIQARESSFPLDPFLNKIQEGLAKQVDPERLENGLRKRLDDYTFVRQLLEKKYGGLRPYAPTDLTALVESLDFGITRGQLAELFTRAPAVPPEMLSVAAKNKALLKQLAFDNRTIDTIIFTGLTHNSLGPRWALFFKVAAAARLKGIPAARIAEVAKAVLAQGGDPGQVLAELDFTSRDIRHGPHQDSPPDTDEQNQ